MAKGWRKYILKLYQSVFLCVVFLGTSVGFLPKTCTMIYFLATQLFSNYFVHKEVSFSHVWLLFYSLLILLTIQSAPTFL